MRICFFTLLLLLIAVSCPAQTPQWRELLPGLEIGYAQASTPSGSGSPELVFLRIDPQKFRFQILHQPPQSLSARNWLQSSQALAVCNIGQYDESYNYLGLLIKNGITQFPLKGGQAGVFLAESVDKNHPQARILDLRYSAFDPKRNPYLQAAQSLMLLDRYDHIRVRRSNKAAHRTLLGQDMEGNVILLVSKGRHTLWELADWLRNIDWLYEVMCMDGGSEAQLAIKAGGFQLDIAGTPQALPDILWPAAGLPMALAIYPR